MLFEFIRKLTIPFNQIEKYIPKTGSILDVGCGHGIFSRMLAQNSPKRQVWGIDPADYKIAIAKSKSTDIPNITFKVAHLKDIRQKFDCIVIIDVLYLLSNDEKVKTLRLCQKLLKKNGLLILKEIDNKPSLMFNLLRLEETIMVKILKYTYSDKRQFYFLTIENYLKKLKNAGFKIIAKESIIGIPPYPSTMYIAKK